MDTYAAGSVIHRFFNTHKADGTPITLAGSPSLDIYKDNSTTQDDDSGLSLTVNFDSVTGLHLVTVDTSSDGTFYATGHTFNVILQAGTVDGVSVVGTVVYQFKLGNVPANALQWDSGILPAIPEAAPSASTISTAVWAEATRSLTDKAGFSGTVTDKTGFSLSTAGILAIWHQLLADISTSLSIGKLIKDNLDAKVSDASGGTAPTAQEIREEIDDNSTQLAAIAASGSDPVGSATWTYTVTDSTTHTPISGATVEVYSDAGCTTLVQTAISDSSGVATFRLLPGTYYILALAPGYDMPVADTEVIS